jgi:hypothetical protein
LEHVDRPAAAARGQEESSTMTSVKKSTVKKATKKVSARAKRGATAFSRLELPPTLLAYRKQVQKRLALLEKEIERARTEARRQAARLLRNASHELGRLEAGGEQGWRKLAGDAQKQALKLLAQLEKAIAPKGARQKASRAVKKVAKQKNAAVKSATSAVKDAAAKAAAAVTPS